MARGADSLGNLRWLMLMLFCAACAMAAPATAEQTLRAADRFQSSGDEIEGWYWLRDRGLSASAEYEFNSLPPDGDIVLLIEALATDRASGGSGFPGVFDLLFGFPGSGRMGGVFHRVPVELHNVSAPDDPLGYHVRGTVVLPRAQVNQLLPRNGRLFIRIVRESGSAPHVAFNPASVRMLVDQGPDALAPASGMLPDTGSAADATRLDPGSWTGSLSAAENDEDWLALTLAQGQIVRAQLDTSDGLWAVLRLRSPDGAIRAESYVTSESSGQLRRATDVEGGWHVQIVRRRGSGTYTLHFDIADQNDAGQGLDAANAADGALALDDGTATGELLRGDDTDWYRIALDRGEILRTRLVAPDGSRMALMLAAPDGRLRRDAVAVPGRAAEIRYAADVEGDWLIRVRRSAGEGVYALVAERLQQRDGGEPGDAGATPEEAAHLDPGAASGQLLAGDDIDMFRFAADQGDIVQARVGSASETLQLSIALVNAQGHILRGTETVRPLGQAELRYSVPQDGPWLLRVRRSAGSGSYSVDLSVTPQRDGGLPGDAGDTPAAAGPVEPGPQTGQLMPSDNSDIYRLSIERGDIVEARAANLADTLVMSLSILNRDASMVAGPETLRSGDDATLRHAATATGDAFVRLIRRSGEGAYAINAATFHQDDGGSGGDAGPCDVAPAPLVSPVTNGWMLGGDTYDCYTIELVAGEAIDLRLATDGRLATRSLVLRQPGGSSVIGTGDAQGSGSHITHQVRHPGLHEVLVRRLSGDGPYRLEVALTPQRPSGPGGTEPPGGLTLGDEDGSETAVEPPSGPATIVVTVEDGGRRLVSDQPFYLAGGTEDPDMDGLRQDWEDQVAALARPWLSLDEEEDWLAHRPHHKVFTFVRVRPHANAQGTRYVLMHFATAWSRDYGRFAVGVPWFDQNIARAHNGDISTAILAWRVVEDRTIELEAVYTSAHHGDTLHSGIWTARGESCNRMRVYGNPLDRWMCATLEFSANRLVLQVSEDKHAVFPSAAMCEDVLLVQIGPLLVDEDCGGGGLHLFDHVNVGEPGAPIAFDISHLFPGDEVWGEEGFCGGLGWSANRAADCAGWLAGHLTREDTMLLRWLDGTRPQAPFSQDVVDRITDGVDAVIDVIDRIELPFGIDLPRRSWPFGGG